MAARFTELIVDAADPAALAEFWKAVLGWKDTGAYGGNVVEIADPGGTRPTMVFVLVSDPKTVKNRLHIDLNPVAAAQHEEVQRLFALGASPADVGQGDQDWVVLADPEGNEFCLLRETVP